MSKKNCCKCCGRTELPQGIEWVGKTNQLCSECLVKREQEREEMLREKRESRAKLNSALLPLAASLAAFLPDINPRRKS